MNVDSFIEKNIDKMPKLSNNYPPKATKGQRIQDISLNQSDFVEYSKSTIPQEPTNSVERQKAKIK